jgi:excinuclease UvrABC ATPase subunit
MSDFIEVRGARQHNLQDLTLRIPKRAITVFTGVSGSGKSSLVVDTIGAEALHQLRDHVSDVIRRFLPPVRRPDVDAVEHLALTVLVDQEPIRGGPRSTVGTATDIAPLVRRLFASVGRPAGLPRIDGYTQSDVEAMPIGDLVPILRLLDGPVASPLFGPLIDRLGRVADIGLEYLHLGRATDSLSGGEAQRVKLVRHLGSSLEDVLYLLDEPSVGLHPRDVHRLTELLTALRDKGNTVLVVEHDPDVIAIADHIVDLGPGAGVHGGRIVFEGTVADLRHSGTRTGRHLDRTGARPAVVRTPTGWLEVRDARVHNLRGLDVDVPTGVLTVVTGVAGSGKSSLIHGAFVPRYPSAIVIDQAPMRRSARGTPATATGLMDVIRAAFATASGEDAGLFSFDAAGACPACMGAGRVESEADLDGAGLVCKACGGGRYRPEALAHRLDGRDIRQVLDLTVAEALGVFDQPEIARHLDALESVGLAYLPLGQPLDTLSGGERQRLKLAAQLHRTGNIYVLDEPTTGLHPSDIAHLLAMLGRLVDAGNTVVVIEHDLDVVRAADWIIDLGPDGGSRGGRLVFAGTVRDLVKVQDSHTAAELRRAEGSPALAGADDEVLAMLAFLRGED